MAEWLFEAGIGEHRAALVDAGRIVEAAIERNDTALLVGAVVTGRLVERLPAGALVATADGEVLVSRVPPSLSIGRTLAVEIVREAIPEPGRAKRAKGITTDAAPAPAPTLQERLASGPYRVRTIAAHESDALEAAGWSELLDEAVRGEIVFPGGTLRMTPTPAMTLFDVDGAGDPARLAVAAATAAADAIRRLGIGGSIGIDFPTLAGKAPRQAVAAAIDTRLPAPFERTAVNGFGFLQIVRPRPRVSLPELLRGDAVAAAARAALRTIERTPPGATAAPTLPGPVRAAIEARPEWIAELVRRTGRAPIFAA